jgi:hypothetical protein
LIGAAVADGPQHALQSHGLRPFSEAEIARDSAHHQVCSVAYCQGTPLKNGIEDRNASRLEEATTGRLKLRLANLAATPSKVKSEPL